MVKWVNFQETNTKRKIFTIFSIFNPQVKEKMDVTVKSDHKITYKILKY